MSNPVILIRHTPGAIERMRNKQVLESFGVDLNTIWIVLKDDLLHLKKHLLNIIKSLNLE